MATLTSTYSALPTASCGSSAPSTSGRLRIDPKYMAPSYPRRSSYNQPSQVSQSSDPSTLTTLDSFSSQAQTGAQMNTEKYIISKAYESLFGPSTAPSFLQQTNEGYDTSKWAEFEQRMSGHVRSIRPYLTDPTTAREIRSAIDEVLLESWGPGRTPQSVASGGMSGLGTRSTGPGHSTVQRRPTFGQSALSTGPAQPTHSHQRAYTHYPANSMSPSQTLRSGLNGYPKSAASTLGRTGSSSYMALPPNPYTSQGLLSQQSQGPTQQTRPTATQPPTFRRIYQTGETAPSDPMSFESLPNMPRPVQSAAGQSSAPSDFTTAQGGHTNPWVVSQPSAISHSNALNSSPRRPGGIPGGILKSVSAYQTTSRPTSSFFHPIDGMTPTGSSFFQDCDESRVQRVFRGPEPNTITKVYRARQGDEAEGSYISARYYVPANGPEVMVESCRLYDDGSVVPSSAWCLKSEHRPSGVQPRYHEASRHAYASTGAETRRASKVAFGRNSVRWYKESEKLGNTSMTELEADTFFGSERAKNDVERASALWWARRRGEI